MNHLVDILDNTDQYANSGAINLETNSWKIGGVHAFVITSLISLCLKVAQQ